MIRTAQVVASITALAIIASINLYAVGNHLGLLEQLFSFSAAGLIIKTMLGIAMLIMVFYSRPRSQLLRMVLGTIASIVLAYTTFGAFSETLALGDAIVYFIGTFIAMTETIEAKLPIASQTPAFRKVLRHDS